MPAAQGISNYTPCSEPGCRKKAIAQGKCRIHVGEIAAESVTGHAEPKSVERGDSAEIAVAKKPGKACCNKKPEKAVIVSNRVGFKSLCFKVGLVAGKIKSLAEKR